MGQRPRFTICVNSLPFGEESKRAGRERLMDSPYKVLGTQLGVHHANLSDEWHQCAFIVSFR
jgi:hypothetical protein